jgi:hypothetical protein
VAVKAGVMNLLSIGAAYGVVALVADGGWAGQLVGIDTLTPVPPFIPVMMFAILFGLSIELVAPGMAGTAPAGRRAHAASGRRSGAAGGQLTMPPSGGRYQKYIHPRDAPL